MPATPIGGVTLVPIKDLAYANDYAQQIYDAIDEAQNETITKTVNQNFADKVLSRPILKDYGEDLQTLLIAAGLSTWDFTAGNHARITLTANTTLTISNPTATGDFCGGILFVSQDGTGSRTLTFPASVQGAPTVTTTASRTDVYLLWTIDGGTKYFVQTMQTSITL
jgi:hypothetical protein